MRNFREYDIWIDAMQLVQDVYDLVDNFPSNEKFILSSQITRSAISIPSNIAEGASRATEKDFARFLEIALGSSFELETQLRIASQRNYFTSSELEFLLNNITSLQKRIFALRKNVLNK
ncbi:four helix bundle protein [Psychroflexus sp. YR1-1]|uniref:Four helix bundle protein n=1 Tax=Psychroflexus aurantiacus TaxID=2709310 RepID=A0A6B3R266_9FLAO|nr:four helix bundle protein [Psychroflexus aurantiacus]NEV92745.1 four helix bundle protein [Psychroflexus aurantiacus]